MNLIEFIKHPAYNYYITTLVHDCLLSDLTNVFDYNLLKYIKKPKLFNISTGQVPEISITKDFLDYAVKEFLLILNSNNFEKVVNENIKNL